MTRKDSILYITKFTFSITTCIFFCFWFFFGFLNIFPFFFYILYEFFFCLQYNSLFLFVFYCLYLFFFLNESGMLDIYLFTITDIHIILLVIHRMSFPSSFSDQERSIPSPQSHPRVPRIKTY